MRSADAFVWDGDGWLMQWSRPAFVASVYLLICCAHNMRRRSTCNVVTEEAPLLGKIAVLHNAILVIFSVVVCCCSTKLFVADVAALGLHVVLCPTPRIAAQLPLAGKLHFWCYIFYLSKYYEMVDTALLIARGKPVIVLHALHHAFMPLVMCVLFDGRVSFSLVALAVVNSFVHIVMYSYYLASALRLRPPLTWKKQITRLQIFQFSIGVIGGTFYWIMYLRDVQLRLAWPPVTYTEGCAGGEPLTVLVGYVSNASLLGLFVAFYRRAYRGVKQPRRSKAA